MQHERRFFSQSVGEEHDRREQKDQKRVHQQGYAQNRVMDVRGPKVIKGDFQPGFKSRFHFKDLNIILRTGGDYEVELPVTTTVHKLFAELLDAGGGDLDHTGLITVLEQMAKHEARTKPDGQ